MRNLSKTVLGTVAALALTASAAFATVPAQTNCAYSFSTNMKLGNVSSNVMNLQKLLNLDVRTQVAASGTGSAGKETSRFGPATFAAVKKFQAANGVSPVSGFAGPLTRAMLNTVCNGSSTTTPVVVSGPISVSAASSQPNSTLVSNSSAAKIGEFVFSGNGTVSQVEFMRTGVSSNDTLTNVYLYEGINRLTDGVSVLTDGKIRFTAGNGLFTVSGSKNVTVRADLKANSSGQTVGVAVNSVTVTGATSTPVVGVMSGLQAIANAEIVAADLTANGSVPATIDAGRQNVVFWDATVNTTKDSYLSGGTFSFIGSAPYAAFSNVKLFVNGIQVGSAVTVDSRGRANFSGSTFIRSGNQTVSLRGDVTGGAGKDYYVRLEESGLSFEDAAIRAVNGILTKSVGFSMRMPSASVVSINSCSTTNCSIFSSEGTFSGVRVVSGASQQTIGKYTFKAVGEAVKLLSGGVAVTSNIASGDIKNVSIYVDGAQVVSGRTLPLNLSTTLTTLSNMGGVVVDMGKTVMVEVKADISSSTASLSSQNLTTRLSIEVQGEDSRNSSTYAAVTSNQVSVGTLNTTFVNNSNFTGSKISGSQNNVKVGSYTISTGNEGIRLTGVDVKFTPTTVNMSNVTNFRLMDGSSQVYQQSNIGSGTTTATVVANLFSEIPANTTKTFDVMVAFNNAGSVGNVSVQGKASYQGLVSLSNNIPAFEPSQLTTVANPGLQSIARAGDALSARYVTGSPLTKSADFNLTATGTAFTATKMQVTVSNPAAISGITIGGVNAQNKGNGVYSADALSIEIPTIGKNIPVVATFTTANRDTNALSGTTTNIALSYVYGSAGSSNVAQGTEDVAGIISGLAGTNNATSSTFTLVGAYPLVKMSANTNTVSVGTFSNINLGTVTVTPTSLGTVKVTEFKVNIPTTVTGATRMVDSSGNPVTNAVISAGTGLQTVTVTAGNISSATTFTIQGSGTNGGTVSTVVGATLGDVTTLKWIDVSGDSTDTVLTGNSLLPSYNN